MLPVAGSGQDEGVMKSSESELVVEPAVVDGSSHRSVVDSLRNAIITGELTAVTYTPGELAPDAGPRFIELVREIGARFE